jgi:hypothetical protein
MAPRSVLPRVAEQSPGPCGPGGCELIVVEHCRDLTPQKQVREPASLESVSTFDADAQ